MNVGPGAGSPDCDVNALNVLDRFFPQKFNDVKEWRVSAVSENDRKRPESGAVVTSRHWPSA